MANDDEARTKFLPDAFKQKRERRKAAPQPPPQAAAADEPDMDEPELPFEDEPEVSDPAPAPQQRDNRSSEKNNERELNTKIDRLLDGMERLQRENAQLKRELDEARKGKTEEPKPKKRIEVTVAEPEVDEKDVNDQFPTLLPTVRAVARKEVKAALDALAPQLERLFAETDEAVGSVRDTATRIVKGSFERALYAAIPDFEALNRDDAFQDYIDGRAPMQPKGVTLRAVLSHAWQNQDVDTISEIIGGFKAQQAPAPAPARGQQRQRSNVDQFVQPSTPRSPAAPARDPASAGKLKQSDWNAARRKLSRGELSAAEYAPIKTRFEKAKSEGRLVDDTAAPASVA